MRLSGKVWRPRCLKGQMLASLVVVVFIFAACGDEEPEDVGAPAGTVTEDEFNTLDANGDSYLDSDEIAEWRDDRGVFASWDADSDSELDRDEINGNAFKLWDRDNNGTINEEEWKKATELWYPEETEVRAFSDWDNDGDSELDADEFQEDFDFSRLGETWKRESFDKESFKTAYFELFDSDNDGRVSRAEWVNGSSLFGLAGNP